MRQHPAHDAVAARAATTGALIATAAALGLTTGRAVRKRRRY